MKAFVFPGQGAQSVWARTCRRTMRRQRTEPEKVETKFSVTALRMIMFEGTDEDLKQTKVTQPAVFLHSVISADRLGDDFNLEMVAGHSLGELSLCGCRRAVVRGRL